VTYRRLALVTGASSGIGLAIARRLAGDGFEVVGLSRHSPPAAAVSEWVEIDLEDLRGLADRLKDLEKRYGETEVLVLNAGRGDLGALEEFSYRQIGSLVDLNFTSQAYLARAFVPAMKRRGRGHLVFIGSEASHRGAARGSVYCASKFAQRGFAQALRQEVSARGVRVSFISPGMTRTPFYDDLEIEPGEDPENALSADDVAGAVAMVVSARPEAVVDEIVLSPLKRVVRRRSN
jgi:NADP-dependent 3-hydroxy acid dehydrogenase YdfG